MGGAVAGRTTISRTVEEATRGRVRMGTDWGMHSYGKGPVNWILHLLDFSFHADSDIPEVDEVVEVPEVPDVWDDNDWSGTWFDGDDDHVITYSHSNKVYEGDVDRYCPGDNIQNLDIEIGGCLLRTAASPDNNLYLEVTDAYKFQGYVEEDTLYIKSTSRYLNDVGDCRVTLYVPENYQFHEVELELGAGELVLENLWADEASLEVGAGQIIVQDTVRITKLDISVGAGNVELADLETTELDVEIGMGAFVVNRAELGSSVDVECAMGSVEMTLEGRQEDYNYQLECAMGNIALDGKDYGGFGQEKSIDNDASREMNLECSMGYIGIWFLN